MKHYTITVNGVAYEVTVEESTGSNKSFNHIQQPSISQAASQAVAAQQPVATPQPQPQPVETKNESKPVNTVAGNLKIEAPMPGKILAIKTSIGQTVKRGDVVLVLEAMKMENEIVATESGVVASINVAVGDMVESGSLLVTLN